MKMRAYGTCERNHAYSSLSFFLSLSLLLRDIFLHRGRSKPERGCVHVGGNIDRAGKVGRHVNLNLPAGPHGRAGCMLALSPCSTEHLHKARMRDGNARPMRPLPQSDTGLVSRRSLFEGLNSAARTGEPSCSRDAPLRCCSFAISGTTDFNRELIAALSSTRQT